MRRENHERADKAQFPATRKEARSAHLHNQQLAAQSSEVAVPPLRTPKREEVEAQILASCAGSHVEISTAHRGCLICKEREMEIMFTEERRSEGCDVRVTSA